jgi:hypothetical protein
MKSGCSTFVALKNEIYILFFIASLFFSIPAHPNEVQSWIMKGMEPNSITIIGEQHKRPESIQLFQSVISKYLEQDKCLVVALEIASSQQVILDEIVEGKSTVSDIEISPIIDHPPFRVLINDLVKMARSNECLKLIAIDAGLDMGIRRDEWMAKILADQVSQAPILALLGNLHTLKKIDWNFIKTSPYVAEILASMNHRIRTYPQAWMDKTCGTHNHQLIPSKRKEAVEIINNNLISLLNASEYETVNDVVDGVILWKCS